MTRRTLPNSAAYWQRLRAWGRRWSDGCTGVTDLYRDACWEHDWHYKFATTLDGKLITRCWADRRFRQRIQARSPLGWWSPVAWLRWAGVRLLGAIPWRRHRRRAKAKRSKGAR